MSFVVFKTPKQLSPERNGISHPARVHLVPASSFRLDYGDNTRPNVHLWEFSPSVTLELDVGSIRTFPSADEV